MNLGSGPIFSIYMGIPVNSTIAASMAGTAAAVQILDATSNPFFNKTPAGAYARSLEIWNMSSRNFEVIIGGAESGTADYQTASFAAANGTANVTFGDDGQFFVPGAASAVALGRGIRFPINVQGGFNMWIRTTENTPITASSTTPIIFTFWA